VCSSDLRKGEVNLRGRLGLFDETGPFGSPTSDSARTSMGEKTSTVLAVIMATANYDSGLMAENLKTFGKLFRDHCGGMESFQDVIAGHE